MVGKYHILLASLLFIFALAMLISKKYLNSFPKKKLIMLVFACLGFLVSIFFTLQISQPIWELIRPMAFLQYPWRFLLTAVFFASFISGALFWVIEELVKKRAVVIAVLILLSCLFVLVSVKFFAAEKYLQVNSEYYTDAYALQWRTSKVSDEYMPKDFQRPESQNEIANFSRLNLNSLTVESYHVRSQIVTLDVNALEQTSITVPLAYFPAWQGQIDNKSISIRDNKGKVEVSLPQGQHQLKLAFRQTPVELLADLISLAGILTLFAGIIQLNKKHA
jgi:hypothetical protein